MTPTADTLALEFSEGLHACLGADKMKEVVQRNRVETAPGCCHSHDFCDANMVLYEVFLRHGMDPATEEGMGAARRLVGTGVEPGQIAGLSSRGLTQRSPPTCAATT